MTTTFSFGRKLGRLANSVYAGFTHGVREGLAVGRRYYDNPSTSRSNVYVDQRNKYELLWNYYDNAMFDLASSYDWKEYKKTYNLYRDIRSLANPAEELVEFYDGAIYPGALSHDGLPFPDGEKSAIPFSEKTDPALIAAVAQLWQWSNWQDGKSIMVIQAAALGNTFVEIVEEPGKVSLDIVWPGHICDLKLDRAGNVQMYVIEYLTSDEEDRPYWYRKEVDQYSFRYYRDGVPYDHTGYGAEYANPYGFVPAAWVRHRNIGSDYGKSVFSRSIPVIDEINSLISHVDDQIHKVIGAPLVMWTDGNIRNLLTSDKRGPSDEFSEPAANKESILMLKGPQGGSVSSLAGDLDIPGALAQIDKLMAVIERKHPEITFYQMLRNMTQVTGPAAERLTGDVKKRVSSAQAAYDLQSIKLFQMATAIAGYRANTSWQDLDDQQRKFLPFGLESYTRGQLEMSITPRPLMEPTKMERSQENKAYWEGMESAGRAGAPLPYAMKREGATDEEIIELEEAKKKAQEEAIKNQQAMMGEGMVSSEDEEEDEEDEAPAREREVPA